jgi:hypothetical protein
VKKADGIYWTEDWVHSALVCSDREKISLPLPETEPQSFSHLNKRSYARKQCTHTDLTLVRENRYGSKCTKQEKILCHLNIIPQKCRRLSRYYCLAQYIYRAYLLTELRPSWGAISWAATQEFPSTSWNPTVFTRALHRSLSWAISIQPTPSHPISLKIQFDIVHPPTSWSSQWSLSFWLSYKHSSSPPFVLHAPPISSFLTRSL